VTKQSPVYTKVKLLPHQVRFINDTTHATVGLVGGYRAGKTYAIVHKALKMACLNPGLDGALCMPVQRMVRTVLIPVINKVIKQLGWVEGKHYTYRKSNPESLVLHFVQGDTTIFLSGAENYGRLMGMTLAWFGMDEIDMCRTKRIAQQAFRALKSRVTAGNPKQAFVSSTPEGFHFLHYYFIEKSLKPDGTPRNDRCLYRAKTRNNPYVPKSYEAQIRLEFTPKQADAYLNAEFVNLKQGNIYYAFDREKSATPKTLKDYPNHILHIGMDFNNGNHNAVIHVLDNGIAYAVKTITGEATVETMIHRLKTEYKHWTQRQGGAVIYPDSSGKSPSANSSVSAIAQLKQAGFECKYKSNNPSVAKERIPSMNAAFLSERIEDDDRVEHRRYFVNLVECADYVKCLEQQGYDEDGKPDKTTGLDHMPDAAGYFITWQFPVPQAGTVRVHR
jgi:hypothetical protein